MHGCWDMNFSLHDFKASVLSHWALSPGPGNVCLFVLNFFRFILGTWMFCLYVYVSCASLEPRMSEKAIGSFGAGVIDDCQPSDLGTEHRSSARAESFLQLHKLCFDSLRACPLWSHTQNWKLLITWPEVFFFFFGVWVCVCVLLKHELCRWQMSNVTMSKSWTKLHALNLSALIFLLCTRERKEYPPNNGWE